MQTDIASRIWQECFDESADYGTAEARHALDVSLRERLSSIAPQSLQSHVRDVLQERRQRLFKGGGGLLDIKQRLARIERALGLDAD